MNGTTLLSTFKYHKSTLQGVVFNFVVLHIFYCMCLLSSFFVPWHCMQFRFEGFSFELCSITSIIISVNEPVSMQIGVISLML